MSDTGNPSPQKSAADALNLRAAPRRVVRFKRNLLIGAAAVGSVLLIGAAWLALGSHSARNQAAQQQVNTSPQAMPDSVSGLPANHAKVKLGGPLPGDLGPGVVAREASLGISPADTAFKPNPEDDSARAERMRLAQQARQAAESSVFVQAQGNNGAGVAAAAAGQPAVAPSVAAPIANTASTNGQLNLDIANDQNGQGRKLGFVNQKDGTDIYNPHALQQPVSPYEILAGSVISASLITGINSDLPGLVVAQVTENLFNYSGTTLLVPQGSRIVGKYDSVVAFGQSRALVVWQRIIMPDGSSVEIDNLPATDTTGYAGLEDDVDYHTWTLLKGIAMSTLLGVGTQVTFGNSNSDLVEAIRQSTQESTNQAGQRIVEKDLNIQPTITIRPGWPLRVLTSKDIVLRPYQGDPHAGP
jgi:type IV secretion system protein VirB10